MGLGGLIRVPEIGTFVPEMSTKQAKENLSSTLFGKARRRGGSHRGREVMKPAKARPGTVLIDEILESLKSVPRARLRIVRDVVGALAEPTAKEKRGERPKRMERGSLLDTPFCGMWRGRTDIDNGQSYGMALRQKLETRGDRPKNLR